LFTGLESPTHLIIVLVSVLLFGSKRIPELAKGLGTGLHELCAERDPKESQGLLSTSAQ
jgi:TatA/E family protein of Tat protein translocase